MRTIIISSLVTLGLSFINHEHWTAYNYFVAMVLFAIYLELKDLK